MSIFFYYVTHFLKTVSVCSVADIRRLLIAAGHNFIVPDHRVKSSGFESGNALNTGKNRNCSSRARTTAVIGLRYRTAHLQKVYRINRLTLQCFTQDSPRGRKRCDGQTHTAPKSPYTHGTRLDVFAFDKASVCSPCVKRLHGFAWRGERTCCPGRRVREAASPCLAPGVPVQSVSLPPAPVTTTTSRASSRGPCSFPGPSLPAPAPLAQDGMHVALVNVQWSCSMYHVETNNNNNKKGVGGRGWGGGGVAEAEIIRL